MTTEQVSKLVDRINKRFAIGDKMKIRLDDGSIVEWTVKYPAEDLYGNPVIWPKEHKSCYSAHRVQF